MTKLSPQCAFALAFCVVAIACGDDGSDGDVDRSDELFAPAHIVDVEVEIDDADWQALKAETRAFDILLGAECQAQPFGSPFTSYQADVVVDGELFERVAIKKKGFFGSLSDVKPSLKIKFDEYIEGQELFGYERLTLNNNRQDPSHLKQCLSYLVFDRVGVPSPRCNFARVTVNGEDMGLYTNVETLKKRFLSRRYADNDGMLFEGTLSDFRAGWSGTFEPKTNTLEPDFSGLDAVETVLAESNDTNLLADLEPLLNLDEFMSYWAAEAFVAQGDGYANNTNNFFLYQNPDDGRLDFLPWGVDGTFNQFAVANPDQAPPVSVYANAVLAKRLYAVPEARQLYFERVQEILDDVWDEPALLAEIDRMESLIAGAAAGDLLHGERDLADDIDLLRDFVRDRRELYTAEIVDPPALDRPLRDSFCFLPIGTISATFDTTYGTNGAPNPFATGTSTIAVTVDDVPVSLPGPFGATAGQDDDNQDRASVVVIAQIDATVGAERYLLASVSLPKDDFGPGTVEIPPLSAFVVDLTPATGAFVIVGFISSGTVTLTDAAVVDDAPVVGSFTGTIFESPF